MTAAPVLSELHGVALRSGQIALAWLGQASFALRAGDSLMLVDPFLSPHPGRLFPPPFGPEEAAGVDLVLCTHEHLDHFDADTVRGVAQASPSSRVVVPRPLVSRVTDLGIAPDRVIGVQPGESIELGGLTIHPVPAMHGVEVADAYSFGKELAGGLYAFVGYVIEAGGVRLYHAGDTIPYDGMEGWLRPLAVDMALLPINGRNAEREAQNLVGNLDHEEAARLAAAIGCDVLVPMHYDMFAANLGYPDRLVEVVIRDRLDLAVTIPARGRPWVYTKAR